MAETYAAIKVFVAAVIKQVGASKILSAAVKFAVSAGVQYGLSKLQQAARSDAARENSGREIPRQGGAEPHEICYGQTKTAGTIVDHFAWKADHSLSGTALRQLRENGSGKKNNRYARVQVLSAHPQAVNSILINGEPVVFNATTGEVTTKPYAGKLWVFVHDGNHTVVNGNFITRTENWWEASRKGTGLCWIAYVMKKDDKAFRTGPPDMSAIVGGKPVYDPRKDSTNGGTGAHRADDPLTWEATENWALNITDYWRSEYGPMQGLVASQPGRVAPAGWVTWPLVIAAANISDETRTTPEGAEAKYRLSGRVFSDEDPRSVFEQMKQCGAGRASQGSGMLKLYAGAYYAPDVTIEAADLAGQIQCKYSPSREEYFTGVRGVYPSPAADYRLTSFPEVRKAGLTGSPVWLDLRLRFCPSGYQAQAVAQIELNRVSYGKAIRSGVNFNGLKLAAGGTMTLNHAARRFNATAMEVTQWALEVSEQGPSIRFSARETAPEIYADGSLVTLPDAPLTPGLDNGTADPEAPVVQSLSGVPGEGYLIELDPASLEYAAGVELYESAMQLADTETATVESGASYVTAFSSSAYLRGGLAADTVRWVYIRAISAFELKSGFVEAGSVTVPKISEDALPEISDAIHGERAGGALHEAATAGTAGFMSSGDKAKLDAIESEATKNQTDAYLRDRANHTGTQAQSTIDGLGAALDGKVSKSDLSASDPGAAPASYDQSHAQAVVDAVNALIAAHDS